MGYMRILRTYQLLITSPFLLLHLLAPSLYIFTVCSVYSEFGREVSRGDVGAQAVFCSRALIVNVERRGEASVQLHQYAESSVCLCQTVNTT